MAEVTRYLSDEAVAHADQLAVAHTLSVCRNGHVKSSDNVYVSRQGVRYCRECLRGRARRWNQKKRGRASKSTATRCVHGHRWTPENTYLSPQGYRRCRACGRLAAQRKRARLRGEAL